MMNLMEKFTIKLKNPLEKYCLKMLHNLFRAKIFLDYYDNFKYSKNKFLQEISNDKYLKGF